MIEASLEGIHMQELEIVGFGQANPGFGEGGFEVGVDEPKAAKGGGCGDDKGKGQGPRLLPA